MHQRFIASAASIAICLAAFTGCGQAYTGPSATQGREIETVSAVELDTSGELNVATGDHATLTVTAGENVIDRLTAEVKDEVLHLGIDGEPLAWGGDIRYELTVPTLDAISVLGSGEAKVDLTGAAEPAILVKGSGSVHAEGIAADSASMTVAGSGSIAVQSIDVQKVTTKIDGAGEITANGTTDEQDVEIRSSGDYYAHDLESTNARVAIGGSGTADVSVTGALDATIGGSGEIRYAGRPKITQDISGSGEVVPR